MVHQRKGNGLGYISIKRSAERTNEEGMLYECNKRHVWIEVLTKANIEVPAKGIRKLQIDNGQFLNRSSRLVAMDAR